MSAMNAKPILFASLALSIFFAMTLSAQAYSSKDVKSGLIKANSLKTDHFQIEFSNLVEAQTDTDGDGLSNIVETVAQAAEHSWDTVITDMKYEAPIAKGEYIFIILDDNYEYISTGALGVTSVLSNGLPYIAIDPWMDDIYLKITTGHEFFHAVQFGYDVNFAYTYQGINWAEATATWVEDILYDSNNDYVNYLPNFFDYTDYSIFSSIIPSGTYFAYALNIWPRFLSEYYDNDIVRSIWETYFDSSVAYESDLKLYDAVGRVLNAEGDDLPSIYHEFALWNLARSPYKEGSSYPDVLLLTDTVLGSYEVESDSAPALYASNYLYFENDTKKGNFFFHLVKPEGASFAVSLVPMTSGKADLSKVQTVLVDKDEEMTEPLSITGLKSADGLVVLVSALEIAFDSGYNWDVFDETYPYSYLAVYGGTEETFVSQMDILTQQSQVDDQSKEVKSGTTGEETPDPRSMNSLLLSVLYYDEDSASFSWNRLKDTSVDAYELRYGKISGKYTYMKEIPEAYTTFATVTGLEEAQQYYFQLFALDSSGKEVGDPSSELTLTPETWIFTDVSYLDKYYSAIRSLTEAGVFQGYSNGSFQPKGEINRAELLKILVEGRDIEVNSSYAKCFPDVGTEWFAPYVCYAKAKGWVSGYPDGTFKPGNSVNKVEALKILFNVYETGLSLDANVAELSYSDLDTGAWYAIYVWKASVLGILSEDFGTSFHPASARTRGEMAQELYRYLVILGQLKE